MPSGALNEPPNPTVSSTLYLKWPTAGPKPGTSCSDAIVLNTVVPHHHFLVILVVDRTQRH